MSMEICLGARVALEATFPRAMAHTAIRADTPDTLIRLGGDGPPHTNSWQGTVRPTWQVSRAVTLTGTHAPQISSKAAKRFSALQLARCALAQWRRIAARPAPHKDPPQSWKNNGFALD